MVSKERVKGQWAGDSYRNTQNLESEIGVSTSKFVCNLQVQAT